MSTSDSEPRKVKAVETNLSILETMVSMEEPTVTALANELGLSPSTVHHHLSTLVEKGYVKRDDKRYRLGYRFLLFGGAARERQELYQLGKTYIDELSRETGEVVRLVTEEDGYEITLYQALGEEVEQPETHLGTREYLHATAAGKTNLAWNDWQHVLNVVETHGLSRETVNTIDNIDELRERLETVRTQGFAYDREEHTTGMWCVSVPITSEDGDWLGAISVSAPTERRGPDWFDEVVNKIKNTTGVIEVELNYASWE